LIEELIKSGHLGKFIEDAAQGRVVVPKAPKHQQRDHPDDEGGSGKSRIAVNTIAGGFSEGGDSSSARKRYAKRAIFETYLVGHTTFPSTPDISFTARDGQGVMPHD
ncbi:hypothetical protein A2U01_0067855, partial [Trifolium medium]|nr:hypothetical protein [Trifolium medium]